MAAGKGVKLYGMWASPAVRRVEWALKRKGIKYEYIEEDLSNKSSELLHYNPITKQVPVLVHDGRPVMESLVILEYIDEVWKGNPILPKGPYERAEAQFWASFSEDKCRDAVRKVYFAEEEDTKMKAIEHLMEIIRVIDQELKGKRFFGGEAIGYLDLVFGWMAFWLGIAEEVASFKVVDSKKFPSFTSWVNNFINDPLIRGDLPPRDKTLEFFRNFRKLHLASCK
ncbi:putative glutathione transferase [Dioscorea sansibarensis]